MKSLWKWRGKPSQQFAYDTPSGGIFSRIASFFMDADELPDALDFTRMTEDGFRRNAVINACIRRISRAVAEPQLKAVTVIADGQIRTDLPSSKDALAILLAKPNSNQDSYDLFEQLLIHLHVAGNAFLYKVRSASGALVAMETIRPDLMGIIPGKTREEGRIAAYTVKVGTGDEKIRIAKEDICHFKMPDALDEFWGLSPLYTIAPYIDLDKQATTFLRAFFKNRGIPSGLLTFDKPVAETERNRVRDLWKDQFQGLKPNGDGWHNISVLDAKVQYQPLSTGMTQLDSTNVTDQTETRICMVFGVPPGLIGTQYGLHRSTFSNLEASERIFWLETLSPMFARISRKLTRDIAMPEFGDDRQIIFDLSSVPALTENKSEVRKIALQGWNLGLLTRNQSYKMLGLQVEGPEGNVVKIIPGTIFVPVDALPNSVPTVTAPDTNPADPTVEAPKASGEPAKGKA